MWLLFSLALLTTASVSQAQVDPVLIDSVWAEQSENYPTDVQQENGEELTNPAGDDLAQLEIFDPNSYAELEQSDAPSENENEEERMLQQEDGNEGEEESAVIQWNNRWDRPLRVECRPGQGIYGVRSIYNSGK